MATCPHAISDFEPARGLGRDGPFASLRSLGRSFCLNDLGFTGVGASRSTQIRSRMRAATNR